MLIRACLLLLGVGVYASYVEDYEKVDGDHDAYASYTSNYEETNDDQDVYTMSTENYEKTNEEYFAQYEKFFPKDFISKFPEEQEFWRMKIFMYLFFHIFAKYAGEHDAMSFWSGFNENYYKRVVVDALFYEYLTQFANKDKKHLIFNPLENSKSNPEDIAIDRIGDYLDSLSGDLPEDQSEIRSQTTKSKDHIRHKAECDGASAQIPVFGIMGKDFPDYCDIPKTSFTCENKLVPGIYADIETGCQVYHACWPHRMDSFLCPIGTTFNQALLTCDFWHESDCASSSLLFNESPFAKDKSTGNAYPTTVMDDGTPTTPEGFPVYVPEYDGTCKSLISEPLNIRMKFFPQKCEVAKIKPSTPLKTSKSKKHHGEHVNQYLGDILFESFRDTLKFLTRAVEIGGSEIPKIIEAAQHSKPKKNAMKSDPRIMKTASGFVHKILDIDSNDEGHGSTELPLDEQSQRSNSPFSEDSLLNVPSEETRSTSQLPLDETSQRSNNRYGGNPEFEKAAEEREQRVRSTRSAFSKPSKPLNSKKHVFNVIMRTIRLAVNVVNDSILPFIEDIVFEYQSPMWKKY